MSIGLKLPNDTEVDKNSADPVSCSIPSNLTPQNLLAAIALFLHRTSGQEEIVIQLEKGALCTFLDAQLSFAEFEKRINYLESGESSVSFSFGESISAKLSFVAKEREIIISYDPSCFHSSTIKRWAAHLQRILQEVAQNRQFLAKRFYYLSSEEEDLLLNKWNATERLFPETKLLQELIEEQVLKTPHAEAVRFKGAAISYEELNSRANRLAHYLRKEGVERDSLVAICMERSIELVVGLLGILKAGGAYVPMDPSYPRERLLHILTDSRAKLLLTESSLCSQFVDCSTKIINLDETVDLSREKSSNPSLINRSDDLCYVIYTSGSTGKPKGAGNVHKGVVNRILWMHQEYGLLEQERVLQKTPFGFDVSVWEFFWPLMVGATLVMADPGIHKDPEALAKLIENEQISTLHFVPSMLEIFLEWEGGRRSPSLRKVFTSGEALPFSLQKKFFLQSKAALHNLYGPTEASIDVTYWPCNPKDARGIVPIGYPIANTQIYILDEFLQPTPIGVAGELFIGGVGLARGYIYREELTKEKFIAHPFKKGERLYRTGDLCRFLPDGAIEYLGRIDNQIKLRGFRIELGEIEAAISENPEVKNCVVIAREDEPGQKYLAAYLIAPDRNNEFKRDLLKKLSLRLPEYMIPGAIIFVEQFPLSPNGKLDAKNLPRPVLENQAISHNFVEAANPFQKVLQKIWCEILSIKKAGITDSFFSLGGHSILAMRLVLKIKRDLNKELFLPEVFSHPTIEKQASLLENREDLQDKGDLTLQISNEPFAPFTLTDIQRAYLLGRGNAFSLGEIYSHIYVENERPAIDLPRLEKAVKLLIERHAMLRAIILEDGMQQVLEEPGHYHIHEVFGSVEKTREAILSSPKNCDKWPLFEIRVTRDPNGKSIAHFYFDLLIADGSGLVIFFQELSSLYQLPEKELPPLGITYRDAILTLDQKTRHYDKSKTYWHQRLSSLPDAPELPQRFPREENPSFVRRKGKLSTGEWKIFQEKAAAAGVGVAALLVTIYGEVLKHWSKSAHFTLNLMFFNRSPIHPQIDRVVGNFSSTLLLEMDLTGIDSLANKAQKVQAQLLKDLEHSDFNGIRVLNELNRQRGCSSQAAMPVVFACALNLQSKDDERPSSFFKWYGDGVSYSQLETPQVSFDHQVFEDEDGSFCFYWDVREALFPEGMVDEMFKTYQNLLLQEAETILRFDENPLIAEINQTKSSFEEGYLHLKIFKQAISSPYKEAIRTRATSLSYGELASLAMQTKTDLDRCSLAPNDLVAIVMEKGWEQIVAALAIHAAGAAFLPIDATLPEVRIKQLLVLSGSRAALVQKRLPFDLDIPTFCVGEIEKGSQINSLPSPLQTPSDLAYVIFTSGSTGTPKGVMIEHKTALNTVEGICSSYQVSSHDKALAISSLSFDLSVFDIFGILGAGGSIYIPTGDEVKNPASWLEVVQKYGITIWNSAPALMQLFMDRVELQLEKLSSLRVIMMSGDWIPLSLPDRIRRFSNADLISLGGATEASIWSISHPIQMRSPNWPSIPYGKPLANQTIYILDEDLETRATWATGMIHIGGVGLARGYLGDKEKTEHCFFEHPKMKTRLYRTGDLGRLHSDGNVEFLGREDLQVKVQGYRIELEEIEASLSKIRGVQQAVVRIIGKRDENLRIAAFYIAKEPLSSAQLRAELGKKLPGYMVPSQIVQVSTFPLTANGKIDLKALLSQFADASAAVNTTSHSSPQGTTELAMAKIWRELLHVQEVGRSDNFFALGGTSFLAFQLIHRIQKELGITLSLASLMQKGTIAELSSFSQRAEESSSLIALQEEGDEPPIFFVHPSGGGVICYAELAKLFKGQHPVYAFQSPGYLDGRVMLTTIEEMASHYLKLLLAKQPNGPYCLAGWSFGGVVVFEMAARLQALGKELFPLILIDSPSPHPSKNEEKVLRRWFFESYGDQINQFDDATKEQFFLVFRNSIKALEHYDRKPAPLDIVQIKASNILLDQLQRHPDKNRKDWGWNRLTTGEIVSHLIETDHNSILQGPHLNYIYETVTKIKSEKQFQFQ